MSLEFEVFRHQCFHCCVSFNTFPLDPQQFRVDTALAVADNNDPADKYFNLD